MAGLDVSTDDDLDPAVLDIIPFGRDTVNRCSERTRHSSLWLYHEGF